MASASGKPAQKVDLNIWHPDCWMLQSTEKSGAGMLAHGVYTNGEIVHTYTVCYGNREQQVNQLIELIEDSPLTDDVGEFENSLSMNGTATTKPGKVTKGILVKYKEKNSIYNALTDRDFFLTDPVRIKDGREYWTTVTPHTRGEISEIIESVSEEERADIEIESITSSETTPITSTSKSQLTERQREVFELAKASNYYSWPREASPGELADQLGVSKATFLEHLHKAEAVILGNEGT